METQVGYVLVSKVARTRVRDCEECKFQPHGYCPPPPRPGCHAVCVPSPSLLSQHPECQEWLRKYQAWEKVHYFTEHTGGTRLGPLHYFSDCHTLLKRGPRRAETSRIVPLDAEAVRVLDLPVCKECKSKMAPFEAQLPAVPEEEGVRA